MNEIPESVRRFRVGLDDAVTRGRRARDNAREIADRFRAHPDDRRQAADFPARAANPEPSESQHTPSDGSDLDFSQAQIMR